MVRNQWKLDKFSLAMYKLYEQEIKNEYTRATQIQKSKYYGKVICPKCGEKGYACILTAINLNTKHQTPSGYRIQHGTPLTRRYCHYVDRNAF